MIPGSVNTRLRESVVDKLVGARPALNQLQTDRWPQGRVDPLLRGRENDRKHSVVGDVSETSRCNACCVSAGRRATLPTMRFTTLSV
jgi:hypothetical protein